MISIKTPVVLRSSKLNLQRGSENGNNFQAVLAETFQGGVENMLQWIDDFLFYAKEEQSCLKISRPSRRM